MNKVVTICAISSLMVSFSSVIQAQDEEKDSLLIGIGIMSESGVYQDISGEADPVPIIIGEYGGFWFEQTTVGYTFFESEVLSLSPIINFALDGGYDPKDADANSQLYTGLESLNSTIEAGLSLEIEAGPLEAEFRYLTDVGSEHKGDIFSVSLGNDIELMDNRLVLEPTIGFSWVSKEYNQYYYGVTAQQSNAFRSAYTADSGLNYEFSLSSRYKVGKRLYLLGRLAYDKYCLLYTSPSPRDRG